jgi:hypothetical protein
VGLFAGVATADESATLDEDFLDYLAELEDDADNWTWFAADQAATADPCAGVKPVGGSEDACKPVKQEEQVDP